MRREAATGRRGFTLAVVAIGCSGAAIFGAISSSVTTDGLPVAAGIIAVLLIITANRKLGTFFASPVQIVAGGLILLAVLGRLFYGAVSDAGGASITIHLSETESRQTQNLILIAAILILLGALSVLALHGGKESIPSAAFRGIKLNAQSYRLIAIAASLPLLVLVVSYGPDKLLERSYYSQKIVGFAILSSATTQLSLAAIAALGCLWAARKYRTWVLILVTVSSLTFLGLGSRRLALIPILFSLGMLAVNASRRSKLIMIASCALSLYLIGLSLKLRAMASHGIVPYLGALPGTIADEHPWAATGQNILISFAIIEQTAFGPQFPMRDLYISLTPLPGNLAGWYDIALYHRLNTYTPAAGLGELGNAGWVATAIVCLVFGAVLAWLEIRSKKLLAAGKQVVGLTLIVLCALFLPFFIQYNLRAATRMLYYALAIDLITTAFTNRSRNRRRALEWSEASDPKNNRYDGAYVSRPLRQLS
jgi:hypothetical protein